MTRITIDDDMVERAARAVFGQSSLEQGSFWGIANPRAAFRTALEAALDRRTGPKDRRAEWDDTYQVLNRRCHPYAGRRKDGADYVLLPRKSDRLKREAEERQITARDVACAIKVPKSVMEIGFAEMRRLTKANNENRDVVPDGQKFFLEPWDAGIVYAAMHNAIQEMKERGQ